MPALRDYQQQDVRAVIAAHAKHRCVIGRAATGLGKAVEIAALAQHYAQHGRVLVLVDVVKLVNQLADTITWYTGQRPGVEMADQRAVHGGFDTFQLPDRIVVSTVQTQYSGAEGKERFRTFDPKEFSAVLLDECELFLAPKARSVVQYYLDGNPDLKCFGCTATPLRTDGVAMAELFDHVAFDRDILWGIQHGWLVPARQAFVRVSLDFSKLRVVRNADGDDDYSDDEVAQWINTRQTLIELAQGITRVAAGRKSIVVCPDVATAVQLRDHLNAERVNSAAVVYGELGDGDKELAFEMHRKGDVQFLVSVMMLTKGYDDPSIRAVFNLRKTRSKRLYTQIMGRGVRPLAGIVDGLDTAEERREAIAQSDKPDALMVNMVGIDEDVRDITILDILGEARNSDAIARAKQLELAGMAADEALAAAEAEVEEEQELNRIMAEALADELEHADERRCIEMRRRADVHVDVEVEYQDGLTPRARNPFDEAMGRGVPMGVLGVLYKNGVSEAEVAQMSPAEAGELSRKIIMRHNAGLCTYKQAKVLLRNGYSKADVKYMKKSDATEIIDGIFGRRRQGAAA
jgi:superfamily II DNA or RNA helicase